jgi:hypothetical protein
MRVYSMFAVALVAWVALANHAAAQPATPPAAGQPRVTPEDLRPPASPVFALLGTTPASIERPQTPRALALNLISAVREEEGLPRNYAL